jgi:hypothetical protein
MCSHKLTSKILCRALSDIHKFIFQADFVLNLNFFKIQNKYIRLVGCLVKYATTDGKYYVVMNSLLTMNVYGSGDQIKEGEMGGICSARVAMRNTYKILFEKLLGKR